MSVQASAILRQIDAILGEAEKIATKTVHVPGGAPRWIDGETPPERKHTERDDRDMSRANMLLVSALKRFSPPSSPYVAQAEQVLKQGGLTNNFVREQLIGTLRALRFEYEMGALRSLIELVHADLFTDTLHAARHLLDNGFKDPAAVLASGVLEQHLRSLAGKHEVPLSKENGEPRTSEAINQDLAKAGAYDGSTQKEITAKIDFRNNAAHGHWDKYDARQVALFIDRVSLFLERYPA